MGMGRTDRRETRRSLGAAEQMWGNEGAGRKGTDRNYVGKTTLRGWKEGEENNKGERRMH